MGLLSLLRKLKRSDDGEFIFGNTASGWVGILESVKGVAVHPWNMAA